MADGYVELMDQKAFKDVLARAQATTASVPAGSAPTAQ